MLRQRALLTAASFTALCWLAASSAAAAELQEVSDWGAAGVPDDVSMHVYVPDQVVTNPPLLLLIHYCGGTASAVLGQARGGGLVNAADQYGFIMVVPSSGRCWDVVSDETRTRDGGGDSHAIRQMVDHALDAYGANSARVYATGDSSGGMMTELLLALYPEVFKAGAAFAGMPAGCRGAGESGDGGGYSYACAGGNVLHTPQEWGDIARSLAPAHTGSRPRVQLFHGDADDIITFPNHTEAIEQWTNVLGLDVSPTSTDTGVELGDHQATRQRWQNGCGKVVVDAFTSLGGDHGPSDALFPAEYVIPFLGLDQTGPLDPHVADCAAGGGGGSAAAGGGSAGAASGSAGAGGGSAGGGVVTGGASNPQPSAASGSGATSGGCRYSARTVTPGAPLLGGLLALGLTLWRRRSRGSSASP